VVQTPEHYTAESQLTTQQVNAMDAAVEASKRRAEAQMKEFERRDVERRQQNLATLEADDLIWTLAQPTENTARRFADDRGVTTEVKLVGPEYEGSDGTMHTRELEVSVYIRKDAFDLPKGYIKREVNWSAIGSSSPAVARAYARAILAAADLAEQLASLDNDVRQYGKANGYVMDQVYQGPDGFWRVAFKGQVLDDDWTTQEAAQAHLDNLMRRAG
jgi:hypothetical protein